MTHNPLRIAALKASLIRLLKAHPRDGYAVLYNIIDSCGYKPALPTFSEMATFEELERIARILADRALLDSNDAFLENEIKQRENAK